mmetsp:Transcript_15728/g.46662  ORF Transcript_15728/g.46662 Transcript_15728/m.46662 type:complete len:285 (+) Transcript_15728:741-1595(+)
MSHWRQAHDGVPEPLNGHQVATDLVQRGIQLGLIPQGACAAGDALREEAVHVLEVRVLQLQILFADVVSRLIVHHQRQVHGLPALVRCEDAIVRLHDGAGIALGRVDHGLDDGLLRKEVPQVVQDLDADAGARAAPERVEHEETLRVRAQVHGEPDAVHHGVRDPELGGHAPALEVVVPRVLLEREHRVRVEHVAHGRDPDVVDHARLCVHEDAPRHVLPGACVVEKALVSAIVRDAIERVVRSCAVGLNPVLSREEFPTPEADLTPRLSNVHANAFLDLGHRP